ncbi:MAG: asparaginase [Clostridiales bacterium]|nr:asparaginase [Clostridiales bacterium]
MSEILVRSNRDIVIENLYRGSVVMIGAEGRIKAYCGDSYQMTYMRSTAKPIMATALIESGAAQAFGLSPAELAVACSSHIGAKEHAEAVLSILDKIGLQEDDLSLAADLSLQTKLREQRLAEHVPPRKVYHNCSGKHVAMLALCRHNGWDIANYYAKDHPVQVMLLHTVADFCGLSPGDIFLGIDGCGVPVYGLPLYNMAIGFYNLCNSAQQAGARKKAAKAVLDAMAAYPDMVAGEGQFCTELIRTTQGRIIGKIGADGVYCAAEREGGWAMAIKVEDGSIPVIPAVLIRAFRQMNILSEEEHQSLRHYAVRDILDCHGQRVGEIKAAFHMELM